MARAERIIHNGQVIVDGQVMNFEETIDLLCKTKSFLDEANVRLSKHEKEKQEQESQIEKLKTYISELESELRVKEDLFKIKGAISGRKINLNDTIKVKLTPLGADIYYHQYDQLNKECKRVAIEPHLPKVDEKGYTKFQLHQFMELYGEHIGIAKPNVIEPLDIILCD